MNNFINVKNNSICVGMPLYNEGQSIATIVEEFHNFLIENNLNIDLLIIDDFSTDNSYEILEQLQTQYKFLKINRNSKNLKHGPTIFNVYNKILELGYEFIIGCDADGQFDFKDMINLISNYQSKSLIIGNRSNRVEGGIRSFISKTLKLFLRVYFQTNIKDANSPLRLFSTQDFASFKKAFLNQNLDFKVTNVLLSIYFSKFKNNVIEVPIKHLERLSGDNGTMWENKYFKNISIYLIKFAFESLLEIRKFKKVINNYYGNNQQ